MGEGSLKRVVSALFLVPAVLLLVLVAPALWLLAAVILVTLLSVIELNRLLPGTAQPRRTDLAGPLAAVVCPPLFYAFGPGAAVPVISGALAVFFLGALASDEEPPAALIAVARRGLALVYIALPLSLLVLTRELDHGSLWILYLFMVIWGNDTFAYYTGRSFGRRRLCSVSPGKTVEGLAGGFVGGGLGALVFGLFLLPAQSALGLGWTLLLSVPIGAAGVAGDLAESLIKRSAGVKDSGTMIPGHGGLLDRIDSLLFAIPVLYYALLISRAHAVAG